MKKYDLKEVFLNEETVKRDEVLTDLTSSFEAEWKIERESEKVSGLLDISTSIEKYKDVYHLQLDVDGVKAKEKSFMHNNSFVFVNLETDRISSLKTETDKAYLFSGIRKPMFDPLSFLDDPDNKYGELEGWYPKSQLSIQKIDCFIKQEDQLMYYCYYAYFNLKW